MGEVTAFVRDVVLPSGPDRVPKICPESARYPLEARLSRIHGWGIFAAAQIPARRRVIEYTGARVSSKEAWRRRLRPLIYMFGTGRNRAIDGAVGGSGAEFVNHSCEPNLYAHVRAGRIWFVSLRRIEEGEELLLDYHLTGRYPIYPCYCAAHSCRGYMNQPFDQTL